MPRIFISYRREDSAGQAGRLNDRLVAAFGAGQVFMDVDDIPPGDNFVSVLQRNVQHADIVLVLIGQHWLEARSPDGSRRLDDEQDFVRTEVLDALAHHKRVIPVLLNRTSMPSEGQLPPALRPLAQCQAVEISDAYFDRDAGTLIQTLGGKAPIAANNGKSRRRWAVIGIAALFAAIGTAQLLHRPVSVQPPEPTQQITGEWQADVFYEWDGRTVREPFSFRFIAGHLTGSAGYLGYPRGIVSGEVKGQAITFETRSQASINDKDFEYVHRYRGEIVGDEIRMSMQTSGPYQNGVPREFVLRRVKPG